MISFIFYKTKKIKIGTLIAFPLLAFYLSFVFTITLFERIPTTVPTDQLDLFWSYKAIAAGRTNLIAEVIDNVILFIPIGILIMFIVVRKFLWLVITIGILLSVFIEVSQLIFHRGLFEFDDIIHNSLGMLIGAGIFLLASWIGKRIRDKQQLRSE